MSKVKRIQDEGRTFKKVDWKVFLCWAWWRSYVFDM